MATLRTEIIDPSNEAATGTKRMQKRGGRKGDTQCAINDWDSEVSRCIEHLREVSSLIFSRRQSTSGSRIEAATKLRGLVEGAKKEFYFFVPPSIERYAGDTSVDMPSFRYITMTS